MAGDARRAGLAHAGLQHLLGGPSGNDCVSWIGNFLSCSPNTYRFDNGVRLADLNHDGLADVVWSFADDGVLLNTGAGSPGVGIERVVRFRARRRPARRGRVSRGGGVPAAAVRSPASCSPTCPSRSGCSRT